MRPLVHAEGRLQAGELVPVTEVVAAPKFLVAILASWCPTSQDFARKWEHSEELRKAMPLLLVLSDEVPLPIQRGVRYGEYDQATADAMAADPAWKGRLLVQPEALPTGAPGLMALPAGAFDDLITGYPTFLECTSTGCQPFQIPE